MEKEPFYKKDCNSGPFESITSSLPNNTESIVDCEALVHKIKQCYQGLASQSLSESNHLTESDTDSVKACILDTMKVYLTSKSVHRHIQQNIHLVGKMLSSGLIIPTSPASNSIAYVELGAGKGMLGLAVSAVSPKSAVVLVERSGVRQKVDRTMRIHQMGQCFRARMDIRHTFIPGLPGVASTPSTSSGVTEDDPGERSVVVMAKHLCGVATDLAIRSLLVYRRNSDNDECERVLDKQARGLAIATCCHHVSSILVMIVK